MKTPLEVKLSSYSTCLLVLLLIHSDRCASLRDSSLSDIFYQFGADEADSVVDSRKTFAGAIEIPYTVFNYRKLYVSYNSVFKTEGVLCFCCFRQKK